MLLMVLVNDATNYNYGLTPETLMKYSTNIHRGIPRSYIIIEIKNFFNLIYCLLRCH